MLRGITIELIQIRVIVNWYLTLVQLTICIDGQ